MFPTHRHNRSAQVDLNSPYSFGCIGAVGCFFHVGFSGLVAFIFAAFRLANQLANNGLLVNSSYQGA